MKWWFLPHTHTHTHKLTSMVKNNMSQNFGCNIIGTFDCTLIYQNTNYAKRVVSRFSKWVQSNSSTSLDTRNHL